MPGKVWGNDYDKLEWIASTGTPVSSAQTTPPDPATGVARDLFPGGSDGQFHYLLAFNSTGVKQAYVDQFSADATTLLNRWPVTGIKGASAGTDYLNLFPYDTQYVSASTTRVVVIMDRWDSAVVDPITGGDGHNLIVTVFDTSGTIVNQHTIYTTVDDGMGGYTEGAINDASGSFCDGTNVYFWHDTITDYEVAKVDLVSGTLTSLFGRAATGALSPGADSTWIDLRGLVTVDDSGTGDLICVGDNIARIRQDGTPVWFTANPDPIDVAFYSSCARSGNRSVWAGGPSEDYVSASPIVHEFGFDGTFRRASAWNPEPVHQAWLLGVVEPFEYHWRWPAFGKVFADAGRS